MKSIKIADFLIGPGQPLAFISGPCVIESEEHTLRCAERLKKTFSPHPFNLIFKASYDKANRSSVHSFRGPGIEEGLRILEKVRSVWELAVTTDVHSVEEARAAGDVCDLIQIPAFLCRQTDLLVAAGETKSAVNVKKGQFLSPWDMKNVVEKLLSVGCKNILLTERGASFGYNNLVSDMRAIPVMQQFGFPVCFDASHSTQLPGGLGYATGGQREFIPILSRCAIAAGSNALFIESHPDPKFAKSDATTVVGFDMLKQILIQTEILYEAMQKCSLASPSACLQS